MKLSPEEIQNIIDNPTNDKINSLFSLKYDDINFEQLNYCLNKLIQKNNDKDIQYILCLAILCKETNWVKKYLEDKNLIIPSDNNDALVVYLKAKNQQSWCKYQTLALLLAYGNKWELFEVVFINELFSNELFPKKWLLNTTINNKNIWEIALDNKNFGFIQSALKAGVIKYNQILKSDKDQKYTIFDYLISYGYLAEITECLTLLNLKFSDIESIWFTAVDTGYHQLVYDAAHQRLFNSKTLVQDDFNCVWSEMLNSYTHSFNPSNINTPIEERFNIVIKAMENNLCDVNHVGYMFFTGLSLWGEFKVLPIDVQNTLKNRMTLAIAKIIKSQKVDINQIKECNWKDDYAYDFNKFKEGLSFYLLREQICNIETTLLNSNACLSYAILSNAVNSQSINNIAKAGFKTALHTLTLNQLLKINTDALFLEIFYHEIKADNIIEFSSLPNYYELLCKLIQHAPQNDANCMQELGKAVQNVSFSNSSLSEDYLIPIWQNFATKYKDIFMLNSTHPYKNEFLSQFDNPSNDFNIIFNADNKRSAIIFQYDNVGGILNDDNIFSISGSPNIFGTLSNAHDDDYLCNPNTIIIDTNTKKQKVTNKNQ